MAQSKLDLIDVSKPELYLRDAWRDPFARLRAEDPVHFHSDSEFGPYWSITRHQDVVYVDRNHGLFSSEPSVVIGDYSGDSAITNFIQMDPPKHDEQRAAVTPVVAPRNLLKLEPVIRKRLGPILDSLPVGETFDWVERVSIEVTTQMLAILFDFPFEERHKLTHWSDMSTDGEIAGGNLFTKDERREGLRECLDTFMNLFKERAAREPDETLDLITMLAHSPATRDMPSRPMEFLGNIMLLVVGGNDTTRNTISGGVLALNDNPDQYELLRSNLSLIPNMVSEMVRWQTPVLHMRRTATQDTELGGKKICKGDKVVMWYISANHDESVMIAPDELMIDRANARQHVGFGFGIHRCMGNRLAEMQLRVVWEEVMKRFRFVEVVGAPERLQSNFIRGITQLPVQVHPW